MRAFVVDGPGSGAVVDVGDPVPGPDQAVIDVERVGVCGTDVELFDGTMAYLRSGVATYPLRLGHEWSGVVTEVGAGVHRSWLGARVIGDTMIGCGSCDRCRAGRTHLCASRHEVGIRDGWPGALAERLVMPVRSLHRLPEGMDATLGALVEPGGNSLRAVDATGAAPGERLLVVGPGTIGLLCGLFAADRGIEVHLLGHPGRALDVAGTFGFAGTWTAATLPDLRFDAVIDASTGPAVPAQATELVEPGRRVVLMGLAGSESWLDTRTVTLREVTLVGLLGGSSGLPGAIDHLAASPEAHRLVAATVALEDVASVLGGERPTGAGPGPKVHIDPRR